MEISKCCPGRVVYSRAKALDDSVPITEHLVFYESLTSNYLMIIDKRLCDCYPHGPPHHKTYLYTTDKAMCLRFLRNLLEELD